MNATTNFLKDLSVVDFGMGLAGALAARLLGDLGATILRAEPDSGDPFDGVYPAYRLWQRGKSIIRSSGIEEAVLGFDDNLLQADVCIVGGGDHPDLSWRPDVDALSRAYPRLVILDLRGGRKGASDESEPAVELLAQARSGLVFEQYSDRPELMHFPRPLTARRCMACPAFSPRCVSGNEADWVKLSICPCL
jgi:crotonobetainyl-CoA:carnitine CoA-transferase CaiB-like acyl-CoA transferase